MAAERMILVLWDIDHTLIESRGTGQIVYEYVFPKVTGREFQQLAAVSGRTELDIIEETLDVHGLAPTDDLVRRLADALADGYRETGALAKRGRVLPGVRDTLEALSTEPGVHQGVLTGNTTEVAKIKIETFGLDRYIDLGLGAYGDDHRDRVELVAIARERASERLGTTIYAENVILIGDTPNDIKAGLEAGTHVLAVASGRFSVDDLVEAGATSAIRDLTVDQPARVVMDQLAAA